MSRSFWTAQQYQETTPDSESARDDDQLDRAAATRASASHISREFGVQMKAAEIPSDQQRAQRLSAVQARSDFGMSGDQESTLATAASGVASGGQPLPHLDRIQASFGGHDVSNIQAHVGGPAADACEAMNAAAYAAGDRTAFKEPPDLHTAAHEAAHVVQQEHGVQFKGRVGQSGDAAEQQADAAADAVVRGESAEALLGASRTGDGGGATSLRSSTRSAKLIEQARATTEKIFTRRIGGLVAIEKEIALTDPPLLTGSQGSLLVECAKFALTLATGPIGTAVANALYGAVMPEGKPAAGGAGPAATGPAARSLTMDSLIRSPVTRLLSIGVDQMAAKLVGAHSSGAAGGDGYGEISDQGKEEMVGEQPISLDPNISFFYAQSESLHDLRADVSAALENILDNARDLGDEPEVIATLESLVRGLEQAKENAEHIQANATMSQWMSFVSQIAHGSQQAGGRSATDLSFDERGDMPLTDRENLLTLEVVVDVTRPQQRAHVVSAWYDGVDSKAARNRILSMPLLDLNVPTKVITKQFGIWAARNEGGQISFGGDGMGYLAAKGRRYDAEGTQANVDKWDDEGWAREGARRMLEEEIMNRKLSTQIMLKRTGVQK